MNFSLSKITRALVPAIGLTFALSAYADQHGQHQGNDSQNQAQDQAMSMSLSTELVTRIQQTLKDRGYDVGPVDGMWGEKTQAAVREFQQSRDLQATGKVNAQTLAALGIDTGEMGADQPSRTTGAAEQSQTTAGTQGSQPTTASQQQSGGATTATTQTGDQQSRMTSLDNMRVSELVGKQVRNTQGENLGEISDVVIDVNNERVHYAILSFGGFMGLGDKKFAYPMRTLNASRDGDHVVLNVPKERLQQAPGFEEGRDPAWNASDDNYRAQVDQYFGDMVKVEPRPNMLLRRASNLMDANVNDAQGNDVGDIEDIVVDMQDGSVRFVVVSFDRGWTEPDRFTTLPLKAFLPAGNDDNDFALRVSQQQVATAPGFRRDRWQDMGTDQGNRVGQWFTNLGDSASADRDATSGTGTGTNE